MSIAIVFNDDFAAPRLTNNGNYVKILGYYQANCILFVISGFF